MNLSEMTIEVFSRGFDHIQPVRIKTYLNESYHELAEADDWPFLITDTTGVAPLTIADVRKIITVFNQTASQPLRVVDRRWLAATFGSITANYGTAPMYAWYDPTLPGMRIFPVIAAQTLNVRYTKVPADLAAHADTGVVPARYHGIIVDGAVRRAYMDEDRPDLALAVEEQRQRAVESMRAALMPVLQVIPPNVDPAPQFTEDQQ